MRYKLPALLGIIILLLTTFLIIPFPDTSSTQPNTKLHTIHKKPSISLLQRIVAKMQIFNPLAIETMRKKTYPGSEITFEQELTAASNYNQYVVSYTSDGLKIYALLTIPIGEKPKNGWPVIVFNHGYIPPTSYTTTGYYNEYTDVFSKNGYIVFKPDYRGNGKSEGKPTESYISADYVTDDMNAIASIKKYPDANPNKIGVWGHSMGGNITLQDLVVSKDIKAAVIWSGVVGSYTDLYSWWQKKVALGGLTPSDKQTSLIIEKILKIVGTPNSNPEFWNAVDPTNYISDINAPVQLDVGLKDDTVPWQFSQSFEQKLKKDGKNVALYTYENEGHNINGSDFAIAMQHSVECFDKYLK